MASISPYSTVFFSGGATLAKTKTREIPWTERETPTGKVLYFRTEDFLEHAHTTLESLIKDCAQVDENSGKEEVRSHHCVKVQILGTSYATYAFPVIHDEDFE
jgi:hypothetical protein